MRRAVEWLLYLALVWPVALLALLGIWVLLFARDARRRMH